MLPVTNVVDQIVHPVQAAQKGRLAAARGADQRRHLVARKIHVMSNSASFLP